MTAAVPYDTSTFNMPREDVKRAIREAGTYAAASEHIETHLCRNCAREEVERYKRGELLPEEAGNWSPQLRVNTWKYARDYYRVN